jgi:septal ring factor EnvC (AmiA/AmiB activator)
MRLKEVITTMSDELTRNLPPSQDGTLAQILTIVQNLSTRLESLEQRFVSLEQKVEDRLYDTRPIWEKVQADIARLQDGQESLRKDVRELNTHWRDMNRKLSIFNDTLAEIQADYRDIYDRVRGLERQSS